jgi:hypothetical protein
MKKELMAVLFNKKLSTPWYLSGGITSSNCIGAWAAKGAASQAASYINLANPGTYDLGVGSAPTWNTATGWTSVDGTKYLTTGIVDNAGWSAIIAVGAMTSWGEALGAYDGTNGLIVSSRFGAKRIYYNGNTGGQPAAGDTTANTTYCVAASNAYYGGSLDCAIGGANNQCTRAPYILGRNNSGAFGSGMVGTVIAAAMYNTVLTATQIAALHTAMMAL